MLLLICSRHIHLGTLVHRQILIECRTGRTRARSRGDMQALEDELRQARAELAASQRSVAELGRDLEAQRISLLRAESVKEALQAQMGDVEVRPRPCSAAGKRSWE